MAWRKVLALGFVASAVIAGCTVTTTNNYNGGDGSTGTGGSNADSGAGGQGTGGKGSGGAATGGSSGSGGGTSMGGGGTAGAGGTTSDSGPATCNPSKETDACNKCLATKCCSEWLDCGNDADCGEAVVDAGKHSEILCIQDCMLSDGGTATIDVCAGQCAHDPSGVSMATNALITCIRSAASDASAAQNCSQECFGRPL